MGKAGHNPAADRIADAREDDRHGHLQGDQFGGQVGKSVVLVIEKQSCGRSPDTWLAEQPVVVGVAADPEPVARRPETSNLLEVERRVTRVLFEALEGAIGNLLDVLGQGPVTCPEVGGGVVGQTGFVLPVAWSRSAF